MARAAALLLIAELCACSKDDPRVMADGGSATTQAAVRDTSSAISVSVPCPATGMWAECSVFDRLDRAGLAPRRDSTPAREPPLNTQGQLLRVGSGEVELYVFPDAPTREREEAKLDRSKYAQPSVAVTMRPLPTLITSSNLIAILHSRNEHLRERVTDAITAGPPQPAPTRP